MKIDDYFEKNKKRRYIKKKEQIFKTINEELKKECNGINYKGKPNYINIINIYMKGENFFENEELNKNFIITILVSFNRRHKNFLKEYFVNNKIMIKMIEDLDDSRY